MATSSRKGKTKIQIEVETHDKEERARYLRSVQNKTWPAIARELGYYDGTGARQAAERALKRHEEVDVESYRAIERAKYDDLEKQLLHIAKQFHVKVDHGKVVEYPTAVVNEHGETQVDSDGRVITRMQPLRDWLPSIRALAEYRQVCARRAALGGLDAPMRKILEVISEDVALSEIARMEAQFQLLEDMEATRKADEAAAARQDA